MAIHEITIYTDGSYKKSINSGGWGFCICTDTEPNKFWGWGGYGGPDTTNQRMELMALVQGIIFFRLLQKELHRSTETVTLNLCTDSAYIYNCYKDKWYEKWETNGWLNSKGKPVANQDLWEIIIENFKSPEIVLMKVKGHDGVPGNEKADELANAGAEKKTLIKMDAQEL